MTTATIAPTQIRTCPECGKKRSTQYKLRKKPTHQLCDDCQRKIRHINTLRYRKIYHRINGKFFNCLSDPCHGSGGCNPGDLYSGKEIVERMRADAVGIGAIFENGWSFEKYTIVGVSFYGLDFVKLEDTHG